MNRKINKKLKAFTLLELIIVLVINGILGTAIMFRMSFSLANVNTHSRILTSYAEEEIEEITESSFTFKE